MLEWLTGSGLAAAAGLNAYIPMIILGVSSRLLDTVNLPTGWAWLENEWVLSVLGVLLLLEIVADKIPGVDSVNDWIQTIVRPAAGGIVFGSGVGTETATVSDPEAFMNSDAWVPVVIGIVLSLVVHVGKALARPAANAVTAGLAAPALSTAEDISSVALSIIAIAFPILVIGALIALTAGLISLAIRRRRRENVSTAPSG